MIAASSCCRQIATWPCLPACRHSWQRPSYVQIDCRLLEAAKSKLDRDTSGLMAAPPNEKGAGGYGLKRLAALAAKAELCEDRFLPTRSAA